MGDPTVIAIDWSGAKKNPKGIWVAVVRGGDLVESRPARTREEAVAFVIGTEGPVQAGFDFSFSVPAWFAHDQDCNDINDVWKVAKRDGELWLRPTPPFWRDQCIVPPEQRFRRCEEALPPAKSIFALVGAGQVGAGSVRGMPLLRRLRDAGFAIWPFDAASDRTVVEIYPTALRRVIDAPGPFAGNDERDAGLLALVMWREREAIAALGAAIDPVTRLEGAVWLPN